MRALLRGALLLLAVPLIAASAPARAGEPGVMPAYGPAVDYMLQCQGCHLADGSGMPGRVPALRRHVGLFLTVPGGREYLLRVPGVSQSPISDAALAALLNWVVLRFGPRPAPTDFQPFTPEEVAATRRPPLTDVSERRAALLREIAERAGQP
jgi:hypothetical protein